MSDITKERWMQDSTVIRDDLGARVAQVDDSREDVACAIAVLPEALAELVDAAQYDHDGLCWGMAPCAIGNHHDSCLRKRDVLRRAGVLP